MHAVARPEPRAGFSRLTIGRRSVVAVSGEIDMLTAPAMTRAIDEALGAGGLELWVDLTATTFMDSTGLRALLEAQIRVERLQRRLTIICPPGPVRRLFELAGVSGPLPLAADRAEAHRDS